MSTLTNSASNNNNINNNHLLHHHHHHHNNHHNQPSSSNHHHLSSSPQGSTGAPFLAATSSSPASSGGSTNINNNVPAADCNSNLINNNNNSNHYPPAAAAAAATTTTTATAAATTAATPPTPTSSSGGYSGVVSGILGVREVSAKLFLPFARTMMPSSHSNNTSNTPTDASSNGGGNGATGDSTTPATPAGGSGTPNQQQQQQQQQHHHQQHQQQQLILPESLNIVLHGYQRKLKTNRKKYFVVYGDTPDKCARLEYFDSEKKFKQSIAAVTSSLAAGGGSGSSSTSGAPVAKRSIALRSCFNINKRHDTKKHIIALFTKDDCFCIVFESEDELYRWLRTLLKLQRGEESEGDPPRPTFEHVWDVYVQRKGLGDSYGILGNYRLCITDKILSLVRIGPAMTATGDQRVEVVEFSLASIRRSGASQRYFYLEVGRSSKTGAGEIWMEVQDSIIAQNMHTTIMKSAKNKDDNNLGPMIRTRSSSANAASKPSMLLRRPTHSGQKPINCSPSSGVAIARERCDSLPSRNRTTSETMPHHQQLQHQLQQQQQQQQHYQQHQQLIQNSGGMPPPRMIPSNRPHSMHISSSHSPPVNSSPLSPPPGGAGSVTATGAYSTGSDGSSLSIDESTDSFMTGSLTPDEGNGFSKVINQLNSGGSIPEENSEEFIKDYSHIDMRTGGVGGGGGAGGSNALSHHDDYGVQGALARRGGSPAPPSTVGSVEGSAYMEMCSPSGSSPGDPSGSCYMAMSPVADYSRGLCSSSSAHSRASSLAEDLVDGYVPMTMPRGPPQSTNATATATAAAQPEEYMNMDPTVNGIVGAVGPPCHAALSSRHMNSVIGIGGMSSAASSCSITSGTPSTDLRLSLEKVPAYIAQSGDDCEMNDRPHRTYSVGSRPEHNKRKLRPDILNTSDGFGGNGASNARARAFSVGSRAKVPRSDGVRGYGNAAAAIIVPFLSANESNNNSSSSISNAGSSYTSAGGGSNSLMMMMHLDEAAGGGGAGGLGKKSSSGSLLPDGTKPPGHGSFDRMGDLMEIDYSVPPNRPQANGASSSSTPLKGKLSSHDQLVSGGAIPGMEDYLDMTGTNYSHNNNNNNHGLDAGHHHHHHHQHQEVEDDRRAAIVAAHAVAGYVEMRPGRTNSQSAETEGDYLNMTPGQGAVAGYDVPDAPSGAYGSASTSTALSPKSTSSPIQITHSPKKFSTPVPAPVAAGGTGGGGGGGGSAGKNNNYLEMYPRTWSNRAAPATPRVATKVPSSEDYLNMTPLMMSAADSGSEERISSRRDDDRDEGACGGPSTGTVSATAAAAATRTTPMVESSSAPDGYMEMWPHNHPNHHHHNTSVVAASTKATTVPESDDYMNMSCGGASSLSGGEDRLSSAPITIQPTPGKCRLDLSEEPKGDGRGPGGSGLPNYLPLGQNPDSARINASACLQQQKQLHQHQHQQQQQQQQQAATTVQAQGSIQTTTGQQSGWVGFSPSKANPLRARCDSRDSGIVTPSGSQATIFPFSPGSPTKPFPGAASGSGTAATKEPLEDLSQNYAELSLSKKAAGALVGGPEGPISSSSNSSNSSSANASNRRTSTGNRTAPLAEPEYVNFWPPAGGRTTSNPTTPTDGGTPTPLTTARSRSTIDEDVAGDYALMNPAATSSRKPSTSSMGSSTFGGSGMIPSTANAAAPVATDSGNTTPPVLAVKKSIAFLSNNQMGFKPIASSQDTDLLHRSTTTVVAQRPNFGRQLSEWRVFTAEPMEATVGSHGSTMTVRPNSVNSEMIGASRGAATAAAAAAAASSSMAGGSSGAVAGSYGSGATRPSSANSERLPPIISATSSSASSTSTLCESKNQSPSASCTAIATATGPRPDSVSSITDPHIISRPPSVSSERELHYASLDLPPCTTKTPGSATVAVASPTVQKMDIDDSPLAVGNDSRSSLDSNTSIPSPPSSASLQQQQQQTVRNSSFSYAQIDFLRTAPLAQKQQQQQQQPQPQSPQPSPSSMNPGADSNDTGAGSA